uniref:bone morphogenetic protein receptor type-2-like n=1 Tax=Myxine glutinosa TaxID=7769 RepID=UPI00358F3898
MAGAAAVSPSPVLVLLVLLQLEFRVTAVAKPSKDILCAWSDSFHSQWRTSSAAFLNGTIPCQDNSHCYGLWEKEENGVYRVLKQGCWLHPGEKWDCRHSECLVSAPPPSILKGRARFCCCNSSLCNQNFTEVYVPVPLPTNSLPLGANQLKRGRQKAITITLTSICAIAVLGILMFLLFRIFTERRKSTFHDMNLPEAPVLPSLNLDNLKLIEVSLIKYAKH